MQRWEYCKVMQPAETIYIQYYTVDGIRQELVDELNQEGVIARLGLEGWELVNVAEHLTPKGHIRAHYYLKRTLHVS